MNQVGGWNSFCLCVQGQPLLRGVVHQASHGMAPLLVGDAARVSHRPDDHDRLVDRVRNCVCLFEIVFVFMKMCVCSKLRFESVVLKIETKQEGAQKEVLSI